MEILMIVIMMMLISNGDDDIERYLYEWETDRTVQ